MSERKEPLARVTCHYSPGCMYPDVITVPMNDGTCQRYVMEADQKPMMFKEVMENVERCKGYISPNERSKR